MLSPIRIPGLFITATDTSVGKTLVTAAIASILRRRGLRVGVCKPLATGCVHRREGLVSEDAEFLAHHARTPFPLDIVCPQRFAEPLAPAIAAQRAGEEISWSMIDRALQTIASQSDVILVEGVGGILVPLDRSHTVLDLAAALALPTVIVSRAGLGTINHTLLTLGALRSAKIPIAGVVINRYPPETPGIAEETNPAAIEKWGKASVLCVAPDCPMPPPPALPEDFLATLSRVDWLAKSRLEK